MVRTTTYLLFCILFSIYAIAQQNKITVDASVVLNHIPSTLYGSCMEDVNHEIYGGLYDQKIMGESFEEPASGINYSAWKKCGGYWFADREYSDGSISIVPGRHTRRMVANNDLDVEPDGSAKLIYDAMNITDGSVEMDVRFLQERGNGAGLLFRVSDAGIGENTMYGYEVRASREDGKIRLIKHQHNYRLLAEKAVAYSPDGWNSVRAAFTGNHILVYVNGASDAAIDYTDLQSPITDGKIGVCTANSPVSFKNISLTAANTTKVLPLVYPVGLQVSDRWDAIAPDSNNVKSSLVQHGAYNGFTTQIIELLSTTSKAGIANRSLNRWCIAITQGQAFTGSCFLHTPNNGLPVTVALESVDGSKTYAQQTFNVNGDNWKQYSFTLTSNTADSAARFALYFAQKGKLYIDQVTLMTTGNKQFKGLPVRADIGNALIDEGLTFMRYAGTMVNAHGYRFKKMIGPRDQRPPYTGHWNEYSTNGFGIEDFLQFCEAAHFTPAFAINIEETGQDAADMVEYLNGDVNTTWGKKRAENGHPKPYGLKYIEIGNEEVLFEGDNDKIHDHYTDRFLKLYNAIHAKDSSIKLVCSVWWRPDSPNTEKDFKKLDGKASYWDYHVGGDDPNSGLSVDKALSRMDSLFHAWNPNTTMKCAIFEENGGLHNMQRALGHATNLNAVRRHGDFVLTSCPANALQPYLQNDNSWDQGQIFFTPTQVWGMPPFYAQQMAASNHLPLRVKDSVEGRLDVTATRSDDGKTLVLHVVNTDTAAQVASLLLNGFIKPKKEVQIWTLSGERNAENIPGNLDNVITKKTIVNLPLNGYNFLPNSYTVLRFER